METDKKLEIIKTVAEEIITEEDLLELLKTKKHPIAYDGFEPSGQIHIAQAILRAINVNKMTKTGVKFKMLVADWHGWANNKMGGDLEKIQTVGKYFIEVWKASGMDLENVEFVWASDLVKDDNYWKIVMNVARESTLKRVLRTTQIMGRNEDDALAASQIMYPCMQAADIFYLKADICQLGMDQRKVNMLAREIGPKLGFYKPVIVSHHMLMGLSEPKPKLNWLNEMEEAVKELKKPDKKLFDKADNDIEKYYPFLKNYFNCGVARGNIETTFCSLELMRARNALDTDIKRTEKELKDLFYEFKTKSTEERQAGLKMSKSKPDTAIFMTDSEADIKRKISKAFCPEGQITENPILEYCKYLIFEKYDKVTIERPEKWGGNLEYTSYDELEKAFQEKQVHPMDLKTMTAKYVNELITPVREHFENNHKAKELLEKVKSYQITR